MPHKVLGSEPYAVVRSLGDRRPDDINQLVRRTFGGHYTLGGVLSLTDIGLDKFPVNATYKIMKTEVQRAVVHYVETGSPLAKANDHI